MQVSTSSTKIMYGHYLKKPKKNISVQCVAVSLLARTQTSCVPRTARVSDGRIWKTSDMISSHRAHINHAHHRTHRHIVHITYLIYHAHHVSHISSHTPDTLITRISHITRASHTLLKSYTTRITHTHASITHKNNKRPAFEEGSE